MWNNSDQAYDRMLEKYDVRMKEELLLGWFKGNEKGNVDESVIFILAVA